MRRLNLIDKAFILKKSSLFEDLELDLLLSIADKMETMHFQPLDLIFQPGHEAYRMYLIVSGQIFIDDKNGSSLAELQPGDFFGDEALFNEKPRAYSASCKTKVELLSLSKSHLLCIIQECPTVAMALLEAYTSCLNFRLRNKVSNEK